MQGCNFGLEVWVSRRSRLLKGLGLGEFWEGLGLVSDSSRTKMLEVSVSDVKVSFHKLKFSVYRTAKTLVKLVVVEKGLTSHQTHYKSYQGRFLRVR